MKQAVCAAALWLLYANELCSEWLTAVYQYSYTVAHQGGSSCYILSMCWYVNVGGHMLMRCSFCFFHPLPSNRSAPFLNVTPTFQNTINTLCTIYLSIYLLFYRSVFLSFVLSFSRESAQMSVHKNKCTYFSFISSLIYNNDLAREHIILLNAETRKEKVWINIKYEWINI